MRSNVYKLTMLSLAAMLIGCAASPTEESFGDAVRATLAEQRVQPQPPADDAETGMDGQRIEGVLGVYRSTIGNPTTVVGSQAFEQE